MNRSGILATAAAVMALLASATPAHAAASDTARLPVSKITGITNMMPVTCVTAPCNPITDRYLIADVTLPRGCWSDVVGSWTRPKAQAPRLKVTGRRAAQIPADGTPLVCSRGDRAHSVRVDLPPNRATVSTIVDVTTGARLQVNWTTVH